MECLATPGGLQSSGSFAGDGDTPLKPFASLLEGGAQESLHTRAAFFFFLSTALALKAAGQIPMVLPKGNQKL